ncbi:MAG: UDP-N-acetylglucosamine 1-carboxyvinyltransferase [Deltaproteobacteria bacterium]|nr:MAG: UDP-N-acetylglucosamine 1-carboxyvinyltransferase [Deltaproteobacteria bacterium]
MEKIRIEGGHPLSGRVTIGGAKNAALPLIAATLLVPGKCRLLGVPRLRDIDTICRLLRILGVEVSEEDHRLDIDAERIEGTEAPYDLVRKMRASILVLGPLVGRMGHARISIPGGCAIGTRPIDLHLKGLQRLGASVTLTHGYAEVRAAKLRGAEIPLPIPTVTGTANLMMAAVLAEGVTRIENAACEPEVKDLATCLEAMGARIEGAGTPTVTIEGVTSLHPVEYAIIPDRIEAGTLMVAAAITGGRITLEECPLSLLDAVTEKLTEAGVRIEASNETSSPLHNTVTVTGHAPLSPLEIETAPYPGFPTDMQAQLMALMSLARGKSVIVENVFENRFMHVAELRRMGAEIEVEGRCAVIHGVPALSGAPLMATDLRASASLILAGLAARGTTEVHRVYHLDRGYEALDTKLARLGAVIERLPDDGP